MTSFDVFLSHNSKDKPVVRRLGKELQKRGLTVWLDEWALQPGLTWMDSLEEIIDSCRSAAVCVGDNGIGPWVKPEMQALLRRFVNEESTGQPARVIPVLLPKAPADVKLPMFLEAYTWVDLRSGLRKAGLDRLEFGITGVDPNHRSVAVSKHSATDELTGHSKRFDELTTCARHRINEVASQWLAQECDPFVIPALKRRVMRPEPMTTRHDADPWEPLSDNDVRALVLGQLPEQENRVRIFSQSGTGKTTLLHYCEQQIAEADDGRLPVRVSALSSFDWRGDVPEAIAQRVLHTFLPDDTDKAMLTQWLESLIRDRRVVFLCDAVDQTDDDLAGFGQFLQSADVCHCPAILTGRPEVEQTRERIFREVNWETYRVEPLDEMRIRRYLGDLSDRLLPTEGDDSRTRERKRHWADLLQVPLLLRLMRRLAADDAEESSQTSLIDLGSRHAIYREAVRHLVDKGWETLTEQSQRKVLLDHAEVNERLSEMAWKMVSQDNFTTMFHGKPFRRWLLQNKNMARALAQIDVTTRESLLDAPGEYGLAWRHLSFCEYFAGVHLADQDREAQEAVVREHGRKPSWQWVFRFALSELAADDRQDECTALARDLIRFGNPFLVYDAIRGDGLTLSDQLDKLCRWLVHREWAQFDYREAWNEDTLPPDVDAYSLKLFETLFERSFRDSRCLHPAWELLTSSSAPLATEIQQRFLAEFSGVAAGADADQAVAASLSLDEHFIQCPPAGQEVRTFQIGENAERAVRLKPFYLGKAPITNIQFEVFDPSHKQWRNQYSPDDDSPALYVNWYMAVMFCTWLGEQHRLPTEEEWEVACRAGTTTKYSFGDDASELKEYAWYDANAWDIGEQYAHRVGQKRPNPWGLYDMHGNVWEWCQDEYSPGSGSRVLRGGSFGFAADLCRSAIRGNLVPEIRFLSGGFRVSRTYS